MLRKLFLRLGVPLREVLNTLFYRYAGGDRRPVFFEIDEVAPALRELERNFDVIERELEGVMPMLAGVPRYHDIDPQQNYISGGDERNWKVLLLYVWGSAGDLPNRALCPRTMDLVAAVPDVCQAFFSILEPGKCIPAHNGPSFGFLRYHLAMKVPERNPPSIRVKDRVHTWRYREGVIFDDSWNHEVTNQSDEYRVCLVVDFLRPMPWPLRALNRMWWNYKKAVGAFPDAEKLRVRGEPEAAHA